MGDLDRNIYRKEEDPYGKIISSPLEKDKRQKEESFSIKKKNTPMQVFSILASYYQQLVGLIDSQTNPDTSTATLRKTRADIKTFRKLLAILAGEDCSHSPIFNQQLSELWHNLLDDCNSWPLKEGDSLLVLDKLKFLLSQIQNFPIGSEYTLGYYFSQHVGHQWIPFPCMRLLQELHEEFAATPSHSTLHNWILLLDEVLLLSAKK